MQPYNPQIEPEATHATVPEEIHPVAAAFGGDIGKALESGGEQVSSRLSALSSHLARMNFYRDKAQQADLLTKYKMAAQNKLYGDPSDPHATVTAVNGNVIPKDLTFEPGQSPSDTAPQQTSEIPAALYNREGYAASGALEDFDNWHRQASDDIISQAKGLGIRNFTALRVQMDNAWASERNSIAKHQSTELNKAQNDTFANTIKVFADTAGTKQDPVSLGRTLDTIQDFNKDYFDSQMVPQDDPTRQQMEDKAKMMALNSSMVTNLRVNGGNSDQFQGVLDKLKDDGKINDTIYNDASANLEKTAHTYQMRFERQARVGDLNTNMNFLKMAMDGKTDFTNPNILADVSLRSPMAGEAIGNYVKNKDVEVTDKEQAFATATAKVAAFKSQEDFQKYAFDEMKKYPQGISQERFNILMGYGMMRVNNQKQLDKDAEKPSASMWDSIDGAMHSLFGWNKSQDKQDGQSYIDYMKAVQNNVPAHEAYNTAVTNSIVRSTPSVATMAVPPNFVITKDSKIRAVFPRTNRKEDGNSDSGTTK